MYTPSSGPSHTLLWVFLSLYFEFTHPLHGACTLCTLRLLCLYTGWTHTLLWVLLTLYCTFTKTLVCLSSLGLTSNFTPSLLALYSGLTHSSFLSVLESHFTQVLLILLVNFPHTKVFRVFSHSRCTHIFLSVLLTLCTKLAHSLLWDYSYSSPGGLTPYPGLYSHITPCLSSLSFRSSHSLLELTSHFTPSLLALDSRFTHTSFFSVFDSHFTQSLLQLVFNFIHSLLWVTHSVLRVLLTPYSGCVRSLFWAYLHFTPGVTHT